MVASIPPALHPLVQVAMAKLVKTIPGANALHGTLHYEYVHRTLSKSDLVNVQFRAAGRDYQFSLYS